MTFDKMKGIQSIITFFIVVSTSVADNSSNNVTGIMQNQVSLVDNTSKSLSRTARRIAPADISGTLLKTRTYYKINMKKYPSGVLTYTEATHSSGEYNYIQVDYNADTAKNYMVNGVWFPDAQWEFIPVIYCDKPGWYRMRNLGRPNQYLTWSAGELVFPKGNLTYYAVLDANSQERISGQDFLVKPVRVFDGNKPLDYYQLAFKKFPKGVVTFSQKENKKDSKFLIVDNNVGSTDLDKYNKGKEWYDNTLFSFQIPFVGDDPADFKLYD